MAKKTTSKKRPKKASKAASKSKAAQSVVPRNLILPIFMSIILSIGAIVISFYSLGDFGDFNKDSYEDLILDEPVVEEEVEPESIFDTGLIQRILDGSPKPYFLQDEYQSVIEVTNPLTGEHTKITDDRTVGLRLYAVPDDYDGRIFAVYHGEREHRFQPLVIDLNDVDNLEPTFVKDPGFNDLEMLNILSPTQRYVASISDEYLSRDHRQFLVLSDLLGERHESTVIRSFAERITATDGDPDGLPDLLPTFSVEWVSDECVEFTVYDNNTPEPRVALRTEEACVLDDLGL
ncbi:hypothetical protein HQ524_01465 [Candidatus Uhrbacteria bacterium]|nr:hypothetical protein [Candidatus Uhrbacteria bacterium]